LGRRSFAVVVNGSQKALFLTNELGVPILQHTSHNTDRQASFSSNTPKRRIGQLGAWVANGKRKSNGGVPAANQRRQGINVSSAEQVEMHKRRRSALGTQSVKAGPW